MATTLEAAGLDYHGVLARFGGVSPEAQEYVLRIGSVDLEPIPYAALVALAECRAAIDCVLDTCFLDRPVLWGSAASPDPGEEIEQLRQIERSLDAIGCSVHGSRGAGCPVLERIAKLWREVTHDALSRLEEAEAAGSRHSTAAVLAEYRAEALSFVEALVQLLRSDDAYSMRGRRRLEQSRIQLSGILHVAPDELGLATWRVADPSRSAQTKNEAGFVTWGIP